MYDEKNNNNNTDKKKKKKNFDLRRSSDILYFAS